MNYQILTLDGGGVKGVYTTKIIIRIIEHFPDLIKNIKFISGTSAGSIIALAIAFGMEPVDIFEFYKTSLPKVFKDSYWDNIKDLGKLLGADYDYTNLKRLLKNRFGDAKLGDLSKDVLIPTIDLDNGAKINRTWKPKFFNNLQDKDEFLYDVAIRSAAAPTYFPVYQGYVDGGLAANNPSICALASVIDSRRLNQKLENISLLSIGAGYTPKFISGGRLDWGIKQWADSLMDLTIDSTEFISTYQCKQFLQDRFLRVNSIIKQNIMLDDVSKCSLLEKYADDFDLEPVIEWLEKNWKNTEK